MAPPIRARPIFPHSQSVPSGNFHKPLIPIHQRADRMKATITENYPSWSHGSQSCLTQGSHEPCCVGPLYIWTLLDGQYWNQIDYIHCSERWRISTITKNKTGSWLWLRSRISYRKIQTQIEESRESHHTIQGWPKSNLLHVQWKSQWIQRIRSDRQSIWRTMEESLRHCTAGSDQNHPQEKEMQKAKTVA